MLVAHWKLLIHPNCAWIYSTVFSICMVYFVAYVGESSSSSSSISGDATIFHYCTVPKLILYEEKLKRVLCQYITVQFWQPTGKWEKTWERTVSSKAKRNKVWRQERERIRWEVCAANTKAPSDSYGENKYARLKLRCAEKIKDMDVGRSQNRLPTYIYILLIINALNS